MRDQAKGLFIMLSQNLENTSQKIEYRMMLLSTKLKTYGINSFYSATRFINTSYTNFPLSASARSSGTGSATTVSSKCHQP